MLAASATPGGDSGDEYDSGDEAPRTREDEEFIADGEDLVDIVREYDEDGQDFGDERPAAAGKTKLTKRSEPRRESKAKSTDPLSTTLLLMKKPKETQMSEGEKAQIAEALLGKMEAAARQDGECVKRGQPALAKLAFLPTVQRLCTLRPLQGTLLEMDVLPALQTWIEPRGDHLPALALRSAIYELLLLLPCQVEHLKRTAPGRPPIGATIVALRKHAAETSENKRVLKELMERWCRPIFGKSTDPRSATGGREREELRELAAARIAERARVAEAAEAAGRSRPQLEDVLTGVEAAEPTGKQRRDSHLRARTPYSSGFLFTVEPQTETKAVTAAEDPLGEGRGRLLRIMKETGKKSNNKKGVGRVVNPRALSMSLSGRNKS
jgi:hypothetical protein